VLRIHRGVVDVGAVGERDPPPRHGAPGIERHSLAERADGLVVVEGEDEPLIEVALGRLRARGDPAVVVAEVAEERRDPLHGGLGRFRHRARRPACGQEGEGCGRHE
jgi:hypothetical protein